MTVHPIVKMRKKVPMNSTRYFFMRTRGKGGGEQRKRGGRETQRDFGGQESLRPTPAFRDSLGKPIHDENQRTARGRRNP
jgi:hypothetical protein